MEAQERERGREGESPGEERHLQERGGAARAGQPAEPFVRDSEARLPLLPAVGGRHYFQGVLGFHLQLHLTEGARAGSGEEE